MHIRSLSCLFILLIIITGCYAPPPFIVDAPTPVGDFPSEITWVFNGDANITSIATSSIPDDDFVLIQTENSFSKLDSDHNILWQIEAPGFAGVLAPVVAGEHIIVPTQPGQFIVVSKKTGQFEWEGKKYDDLNSNTIQDIEANERYVFVARYNSLLSGYNLRTGELIWEKPIPYRSAPYLQIIDNDLYVASKDLLVAYDITSGEQNWQMALNRYAGPIAESNKTLFVVDGIDNMRILAIDSITKQIIWQQSLGKFFSTTRGGILINKDTIYLTGEGVVAISIIDGHISWKSEKTQQLGHGVIVNEILYVRDNWMKFYAFDINSGEITGELTVLPDSSTYEFIRNPVVFDNNLALPFGDNHLYFFEP